MTLYAYAGENFSIYQNYAEVFSFYIVHYTFNRDDLGCCT